MYLQLVNVNLQKDCLCIFLAQLIEFRREHLARPAPLRKEVDHNLVNNPNVKTQCSNDIRGQASALPSCLDNT